MNIDRDLLATGGGMALLLAGRKIAALSMFSKGVIGLEKRWRAKHPEVAPGLQARWNHAAQFYSATHQHDTNRMLHRWGIPLIVGGAVVLLVAKPYRAFWAVGAAGFTAGWAMNFVGHAYEGKKPAFADDPLSFIAGPVWDLQQARRSRQVPAVAPLVAAAVN
jgi:hypothetical protein